jgi:hypothetical protein
LASMILRGPVERHPPKGRKGGRDFLLRNLRHVDLHI